VLGVSTISFGIWKLTGARDFSEFRQTIGSILPKIPKNEIPSSRTEFDGLNDLLMYLTTWKKS
jgi:hypothetical protein